MSHTYTIPVTWMMYGTIEVEANSLDEAIELVYDYDLPDNAEFLSDSFEINYDEADALNPDDAIDGDDDGEDEAEDADELESMDEELLLKFEPEDPHADMKSLKRR